MFTVFRIRNFTYLWLSQLCSTTGDWVLFAALPFYIYQVTGSSLATGAMFMVQVLPRLLLGSVAGVFVDRLDKRWTMIACDALRALTLLLLLLIPVTGWIGIVYLVAVIEHTLATFYYPAERSLVPRLVGADRLGEANSLFGMGGNLARIVGPAVGGAMLAMFGLMEVVLITVTAYVISSLLIVLIRVSRQEEAKAESEKADAKAAWLRFWRDWLDGIRLLKENRLLLSTFVVIGLTLLGDAMLTPLLVVFAEDVLQTSAAEFGWLLTARGVGGVLGGLLIGLIASRLAPQRLMTMGILLSGAILFAIVNVQELVVVLPLIALFGIPVMAWLISTDTLLQQVTEEKVRGRVFGAFGTTTAVATLAGMGMGSLLADGIGVVVTLNIAAGMIVVAGVAAMVLLRSAAAPVVERSEKQAG